MICEKVTDMVLVGNVSEWGEGCVGEINFLMNGMLICEYICDMFTYTVCNWAFS